MPGDVKLPGIGPVSKRALLIGGAGAVVVMGVLWYRKRTSTPASTSDTTGDTSGVDTSGLDTSGDLVSGLGSGGTITDTSTTTNTGPGTFTSNAQWTQYAEQILAPEETDGGAALSAALGAYIVGKPVDATQESLIDQAISVAGYPPVGGPTGYPPGIRQSPPGGQPGGGTTTPTKQYATVQAGWGVDQWILDVAAGKAGFPDPGFTYSKWLALNPGGDANIDHTKFNKTKNTRDNVFKQQAVYRVL